MAVVIAIVTFACVSCEPDYDTHLLNSTVNGTKIPLSDLNISLRVEKGSLPEKYAKEVKLIVNKNTNSTTINNIETYIEKYVVPPTQQNLNEVAAKSGCYDFSVTILVYDAKDSTNIIYKKELKPEIIS